MKPVILLTLFLVLLSACSPAPALPATTSALTVTATLAVPTLTATPSPSTTPYPTETPAPPTQTPLPTIPTFTPSFDARTIVTATPAPKAECPKEDLVLMPDFLIPLPPACFDTDTCVFGGTEKEIQKFLNQGGSVNAVINRLRMANRGKYREYAYQDLTGDSVPDLMFNDFMYQRRLHILYCSQGRYEVFTSAKDTYGNDQIIWNPVVRDLNLDNIPEIVFSRGVGRGCCDIYTLEWNGNTFQNISHDAFTRIEPVFKDIDHNGTLEIIAESSSDFPAIGIARNVTFIWGWNGQTFDLIRADFPSPVFRVQAINDADREVVEGNYEKALLLYQDAIFDEKLAGWSDAWYSYYVREWETKIEHTPEPTPIPDLTEYPRLAAYAYYRMVILHTYLGETDAAQLKYTTLQEKFPAGNPGHPYVEMASAFWDAYQSSQKMYNACAAAIAYADVHPEILVPLGSDYHGWQSHTYVPTDVCPFR